MEQLVLVGHGRPAHTVLWAMIARAQREDPLAPVTVVVPSGYAGASLRRRLVERHGGLVNVRFVGLEQLADDLAAPALAGSGHRPLSPALRREVLRGLVASRDDTLRRVADHPDALRSLDRAVRHALATRTPTARLVRDRAVVEVAEAFRAATTGFWDPADLLAVAARAVAGDPRTRCGGR